MNKLIKVSEIVSYVENPENPVENSADKTFVPCVTKHSYITVCPGMVIQAADGTPNWGFSGHQKYYGGGYPPHTKILFLTQKGLEKEIRCTETPDEIMQQINGGMIRDLLVVE